jgi:hypothetical protein
MLYILTVKIGCIFKINIKVSKMVTVRKKLVLLKGEVINHAFPLHIIGRTQVSNN